MRNLKQLEDLIKDVYYFDFLDMKVCDIYLKNDEVVTGITPIKDMTLVDGVPLSHKLAYKDAFEQFKKLYQ